MKTATSERVSEMTVKPISRAPVERRPKRALALLHVAHDVLDHHDSVVDHEAGADGQRHQREIVEAEAAQPHDPEGRDDRQGQGDAGDDGGPKGAQEQQHDQHDERGAEHKRELNVADRGADGLGAVVDDFSSTPLGMARCSRGNSARSGRRSE